MNWTLIIAASFLSALLVFPGFELAQRVSIKKGEIPPRGTQVWQGRPFFFWTDYKTLLYGDLVFLSLLNGFTLNALLLASTVWHMWLLAVLFGSVFTYAWFTFSKHDYTRAVFSMRWDWHFVPPNATVTTAGKYHLAYFFFEACVFGVAAQLLWQPIPAVLKLGALVSLCGYVVTVTRDAGTYYTRHK